MMNDNVITDDVDDMLKEYNRLSIIFSSSVRKDEHDVDKKHAWIEPLAEQLIQCSVLASTAMSSPRRIDAMIVSLCASSHAVLAVIYDVFNGSHSGRVHPNLRNKLVLRLGQVLLSSLCLMDVCTESSIHGVASVSTVVSILYNALQHDRFSTHGIYYGFGGALSFSLCVFAVATMEDCPLVKSMLQLLQCHFKNILTSSHESMKDNFVMEDSISKQRRKGFGGDIAIAEVDAVLLWFNFKDWQRNGFDFLPEGLLSSSLSAVLVYEGLKDWQRNGFDNISPEGLLSSSLSAVLVYEGLRCFCDDDVSKATLLARRVFDIALDEGNVVTSYAHWLAGCCAAHYLRYNTALVHFRTVIAAYTTSNNTVISCNIGLGAMINSIWILSRVGRNDGAEELLRWCLASHLASSSTTKIHEADVLWTKTKQACRPSKSLLEHCFARSLLAQDLFQDARSILASICADSCSLVATCDYVDVLLRNYKDDHPVSATTAFKLCKRLLTLSPSESYLLLRAAEAALYLERISIAYSLFEALLNRGDGVTIEMQGIAENNLGFIESTSENGSPSKAFKHFTRAALLLPQYVEPTYNYTLLLLIQGRKEHAKKNWLPFANSCHSSSSYILGRVTAKQITSLNAALCI